MIETGGHGDRFAESAAEDENELMRWIIGDIHGMLRPLQTLLDAISRVDTRARFYFAGDYINRGPDSRAVIESLLQLSSARFIRGNHDDIFEQILRGTSYSDNASGGDRLLAFQWFMQHGLDQTFISYGADPDELHRLLRQPTLDRLASLLRCVPEKHRQFIYDLAPVIEDNDLFVAHGKWDPDDLAESPNLAAQLAIDPLLRQRLLWHRYEPEEVLRLKAWHRTGYFGHTPVDLYGTLSGSDQPLPIRATKIVLLDSGAALSPQGRLTAFCHETQSCLQADHFGQLIQPDQAP